MTRRKQQVTLGNKKDRLDLTSNTNCTALKQCTVPGFRYGTRKNLNQVSRMNRMNSVLSAQIQVKSATLIDETKHNESPLSSKLTQTVCTTVHHLV